MPRTTRKQTGAREKTLPKVPGDLSEIHRFPAVIDPPLRGMTKARIPRAISGREEVAVRPVRPRWTQAQLTRLQQSASRHREVKASLGEKWTAIGVRLAGEKGGSDEPIAVFYSYTHQLMVEVLLSVGGKVQEVEERRYQPPATDEEIATAVRLAHGDRRLRSASVRELDAGAIAVSPGDPEDPGFGRRLLDLRFFAPEDRLTRYMAIVDVAEGRVLEAGPVTLAKERKR